jgi:hypothetical protein
MRGRLERIIGSLARKNYTSDDLVKLTHKLSLVARVSARRAPGITIAVLSVFPGAAFGLTRATCYSLMGTRESQLNLTVHHTFPIGAHSVQRPIPYSSRKPSDFLWRAEISQ